MGAVRIPSVHRSFTANHFGPNNRRSDSLGALHYLSRLFWRTIAGDFNRLCQGNKVSLTQEKIDQITPNNMLEMLWFCNGF